MMHAADAWAEKPDSAFGPEVWNREKELLSSIDSVSNPEEVALTYLKLARIFKDNHRELEYLDLAEESASRIEFVNSIYLNDVANFIFIDVR